MAKLAVVPMPDLTVGTPPPATSDDEHIARIEAAQAAFERYGIDYLVVYGDREYFADLYYLTGVDLRFEEGLYVLGREGRGTLLLGNENHATWSVERRGIMVSRYQAFSPAGQRRDAPVLLDDLLRSAGLYSGVRVGVAGGKAIDAGYVENPDAAISAPAYVVDGIRRVVGGESVRNVDALFTDPEQGLRATVSVHELARFEYGSSIVSTSVLGAMVRLEPGISESELASLLRDDGVPLTCHTMVSFGPRQGLYSPSAGRARLGDAFMIAQGVRGGLTCRAGAIARSENDLHASLRGTFSDLMTTYFDTVATWHETVRVGVSAGAVVDAVLSVPRTFEHALNPGHLLHLEEWTHSPFVPGSPTVLRSGMRLQCDIIPVTSVENVNCNIEDGVVLADKSYREAIANEYPELWERIERRREHATQLLGVALHESLLPVSNGLLWHTPYGLDSTKALVRG